MWCFHGHQFSCPVDTVCSDAGKEAHVLSTQTFESFSTIYSDPLLQIGFASFYQLPTLKSWDPQPESWLEYWLSLMLQGWEWNLEAHQSSMQKQNAGAVTHGWCNGFQKFKNRLAMVDQLLRQSPVLFSTPCYGSYSVRWCFLLSEIWTDPNTFSLYASQPAGNLQIRGCKKASGSLKIAVQCASRSCLVKLSLERFFFWGHSIWRAWRQSCFDGEDLRSEMSLSNFWLPTVFIFVSFAI